MKLNSIISFVALFAASSVYASNYNTEILKVQILDDRYHEVNGNTCDIGMQYFNGSATGSYFNGVIKQGSSVVTKKFKDGRVESTSRILLIGKDSKNNQCNIFIEDNSTDEKGNTIISKPTIVTDCPELTWLQTADLQGQIKDKKKKGKILQIMWNKSNKAKIPYPPVKMPDTSRTYDKELFVFEIGGSSDISAMDFVMGGNGEQAVLIPFNCTSNFNDFNGECVDWFTDTRLQFPGQVQTLSARYILQGKDDEGRDTKIYVENNGIDESEDHTTFITEPFVITDNPKWAWIEKAPLHGYSTIIPTFQIHVNTVDDPSLWSNQSSDSSSSESNSSGSECE